MQITQDHVMAGTLLGANLVADGATFRIWAPRAKAVHVKINADAAGWAPGPENLLQQDDKGFWAGFVKGAKDGDGYRFYVIGTGNATESSGFKRDPYSRELKAPDFPECDCILRDPKTYPWNSRDFRPPAFSDLVLYQLHVGTFYAVDANGVDNRGSVARFLDVAERVEYLAELGVNGVQLMPIDEFRTARSKGYNGVDYFSPEVDYAVPEAEIDRYLQTVNALLAKKQCPPLTRDQLIPAVNQLKALVDIFHMYGIAVFFDVVYNHAGGDFGDQSMYYCDRCCEQPPDDPYTASLYFTNEGWAGGLIFDFGDQGVREFLISNARYYVEEFHADGLRYDEVSVIDNHGGWFFCQELARAVKPIKPDVIHIAEYWNDWRWKALWDPPDGMGFDAIWHDGLREAVRTVIRDAARGRDAAVNLDPVSDALYKPYNFPAAWKAVQHLENHDGLKTDQDDPSKVEPRIPRLADWNDSRSWYAKSRTRVATGLLLTAPGIPMLFMGEEFLEDKLWSDNPDYYKDTLIWWDGLKTEKAMIDHLCFTRDLIALRRRQPAFTGENINVFNVHNGNRIIAFQRWLEGYGRDVVVVASLNESTFWRYGIGFPGPGRWLEVFNSDVYENWSNPRAAGNGGMISADGGPMHGMGHSAEIVIPANSILVFARDFGD
jgi:1,4-alpha-glucan branching enzyme